MEGRQRRSFTDDYKRQAVDSSGRSIGSVAKELGLRDSVLRRWVEQRGTRREPTAASRRPTTQATLPSADHAAEIARLQRENERLRMERDILKNCPGPCPPARGRNSLCYPPRLEGSDRQLIGGIVPVKKRGPWVDANLRVVTPFRRRSRLGR
jgi:transposase